MGNQQVIKFKQALYEKMFLLKIILLETPLTSQNK